MESIHLPSGMWSFQGSQFLTLEFPRVVMGATQFCRNSRGVSLEIPGVFFRKAYPQPPHEN